MAGLQRFISYIYRYENDERQENAGFAKVEIRGNVCRMEVHIQNINLEQRETTVYLFTRKENVMQGILVGEIALSKGRGDVRYAFDTKELAEFGITVLDLEGIFIPCGEEIYLASQWKEGTVTRQRFQVIEKRKAAPAEAEGNDIEESADSPSENGQNVSEQRGKNQSANGQYHHEASEKEQQETEQEVTSGESDTEESSQDQKVTAAETKSSQSNTGQMMNNRMRMGQNRSGKRNIQATELPMEEFLEDSSWERIFQKLRLKETVFYPFEGQEIECIRMQLHDLQELPKKYWYIGNNSFLLHGFFNYRHIILGEMQENGKKAYFIGVPGVFANQERIMASMFGFPEFRTAKMADYKTGNFGYWYRII